MPLPSGQISAYDMRRFCAVGDNINYYPAPISLNDAQVRSVNGKSSGATHSFSELQGTQPVGFPHDYANRTCRVTSATGPPDVYTGPRGFASYVGGSWGSISRNTDTYFFEGACNSGVSACLMGVFYGNGGHGISTGHFYVIFGGNRTDVDDYEYFIVSSSQLGSGGSSVTLKFPRSSASVVYFGATSHYNQTRHSWGLVHSQQHFYLANIFNSNPYVIIRC